MFQLTDYLPAEKLQSFYHRNHIKKLSLFGSALRDELTPECDIDLLVEFDEEYVPGLFKPAGMEIELTETIGRKVDLRSPLDLSRFFRDEVVKQARVEYEQTDTCLF